ncbi:MAG TPA: hypothetical protein VGF75_07235 [Candidatus Saccharimonadales bacterium]|jgi:hypothetical protein
MALTADDEDMSLEDRRMDIEFKIVSTVFMSLFYTELIEKFAHMNNAKMVEMFTMQRDMAQKLSIRFNKKLKQLETIDELRKQVPN